MKQHIAHFRIDGSDLTRLVRDVFLSGDPDKAWRMITKSLTGGNPGEVEHYATQILDGKMKLVGNETAGLQTQKDAAKGYRKQIQYIYAGRVRVQDKWYRPRAEVTAFGIDDNNHATRKDPDHSLPVGVPSPGQTNRWWRDRVDFYTRDGEIVVEIAGRGRSYPEKLVVFEPVGNPPSWWDPHTTPSEALDEFVKVRGPLQQESWDQTCDGSDSEVDDEEAEDEDERPVERTYVRPSLEEYNRLEEEKALRIEALIKDIALKVREQAGDDRLDIPMKDGTKISVARAPFINWALRRTSLWGLAPPWNEVSPCGMKLPMDDPSHSDWLIEAGIPLEEGYSGPISEAAHHVAFEIQEALGQFECHVLVDGPSVSGVIGEDIIVLPDLREDRLDAILNAKAIITEKGGKLAHLALVAMERQVPMLRVEDAMRRFRPGLQVMVVPHEGRIERLFRRVVEDD